MIKPVSKDGKDVFEMEEIELEMDEVLTNLQNNLVTLRTGRANAKILDRVKVDYYGEMTPIDQIAHINVVEGTQLLIKPYERRMVKEITHAIAAANLGFNPQAEAEAVRIVFPPLTQERRKELAKEAKKYGDEAKVNLRNIRRDFNNAVKKSLKAKKLAENEEKVYLDDCQKLTDNYVKKVDDIVSEKEKDIMTL